MERSWSGETGGDQETVLLGGNTSVVLRAGNTVRRRVGHWTPAVHALLGYLAAGGFNDAPQVFGIDEQHREVLGYVEGQVGLLRPGHPLPPWFVTEQAAYAVGDWLRRYHAAVRDAPLDPALPWRLVPGRALRAGEVVVHHDVAPYNTVHRPNGGITVLDWDFCAPGDPLQDVCFSCWQWVPLWADRQAAVADHGGASTPAAAARRTAALLEGYAATDAQRARLLEVTMVQMEQHARTVERLAAQGDQAFVGLVQAGVARNARLDARWVRRHREPLERAVRGVP